MEPAGIFRQSALLLFLSLFPILMIIQVGAALGN